MQYLLTLLVLCWISCYASATVLSDTVNTGKEHLTLARQYEAQSDLAQAIEHYELAKSGFTQEQDYLNLVYVLTQLASLHTSDTATHARAEVYLDSAQLILKEKRIENDTLHTRLWSTKAELALVQEDYDKAIECYQQSVEIKKAFYGENHLGVADDLEYIGDIYLYILQAPYASESYHQNTRDIRESINGRNRLFYNTVYSLAYANRLRGDYDKALAYAFEVQRGYDSLIDTTPFNMLAVNSLIGTIYYDLDSINNALYYNSNAIKIGRQIPGEDLSTHYNNQAEYYLQKQVYDSSLHYIQLAIEKQTDSKSMAISYHFLGNVYREAGKLDQAFDYYERSKKLKESAFNEYHTQLATLYIDIGQTFIEYKQLDSALIYYQKGLERARTSRAILKDTIHAIQLEDDFGSVERALVGVINVLTNQYEQTKNQNFLEQVLPYFNLFDQFMNLSRTDFSTEGAKLILSGNNKSIYEKAIASYYHLFSSYPSDSLLDDMFHYMEKSKAMVLLESIRETNRNQQLLPDSIIQQYQSLQGQLAYYQSELIRLRQQSNSVDAEIGWQQKRAGVLRKLELLDDYVQNAYPNYSAFSNDNFTISLDTLQEALPNHRAVISYFWGDSSVYGMLITKNRKELLQIKSIDELRASINQYQDVLVNDNISDPSYTNFLRFQESALDLYESLLAPLQLDTTIRHLTIIPDGELAAIPFESFISFTIETVENDIRYEDLPYLIHQFNFSYELSSSVAFWNKQRSELATSRQNLNIIAFGIKDFSTLSKQRSYPPLGGAEDEVRYIQERFPQAQIFLNEEATESAFKQHALEAGLLHVATHGMADRGNPLDSRFIFYPAQEEDGMLYLHELYDLSLETQLLVLGACESGVGKYYAGEGSFSLARSFIYSGCQSVLMSLWEIQDRLTTQMVTKVYNQLAKQITTDEALRTTKLTFIKQGRFAHPQCWAGMVLLGNTPTKFTPSSNNGYTIAVVSGTIVLLVLLALWLFRKYKQAKLLAKLGFQRQKV